MARMAFDRNNHLWQEQPSGTWKGPNGQFRALIGDVKKEFGPLTMVRNLPQPAADGGAATTFPAGGFART